jgi:hypothetical protein
MPLTAILDHQTVEIDNFNESDRGKNFRCPLCEDKMTLVFPEKRISHFRHLESTCGLSESYEHIAMKKLARDLLKRNNSGQFIFEKRIRENDDFNIIDLEIQQYNRKIAVECQASPMKDEDCKERTQALNRLGYSVLWLLSSNNFDKRIEKERLVKQPESFIHSINFGRVYYLYTSEPNIVYPVHFNKIERTREVYEKTFRNGDTYYFSEEPYDGEYDSYNSYTYTLKKKRMAIQGSYIKNLAFLCQTSTYVKNTIQKFGVARFYDEKFW